VSTYRAVFGTAPFISRDAAALGWSERNLREFVRAGVVRRVLRGVYLDATVPDDLASRTAALAKAVPSGDVISLRTAGWLWSADVLPIGAHREIPPVDLMAPSGSAGPRRAGCRGRTGPIAAYDVMEMQGVLVTTPARTTADLLRLLRRPDALAAGDAMRRATGVDPAAVSEVLERFRGQRGVVQARELLELSDPRAESPQESRTRLRCVDAGFPCPEPQIVVTDGSGEFLARLDMGYRKERKAIEFDGADYHYTIEQVRHDQARREDVERDGWVVLVVTTEHVLGRGLVFEGAVAELLGIAPRLTRHHPKYGGWDRGEPSWPTVRGARDRVVSATA
jgi:Transcriptional regulator, AbiEi antitoxin